MIRYARRDTFTGSTVAWCPCGWRSGPHDQRDATRVIREHNASIHGIRIPGRRKDRV